jgi:hypothetical protein
LCQCGRKDVPAEQTSHLAPKDELVQNFKLRGIRQCDDFEQLININRVDILGPASRRYVDMLKYLRLSNAEYRTGQAMDKGMVLVYSLSDDVDVVFFVIVNPLSQEDNEIVKVAVIPAFPQNDLERKVKSLF